MRAQRAVRCAVLRSLRVRYTLSIDANDLPTTARTDPRCRWIPYTAWDVQLHRITRTLPAPRLVRSLHYYGSALYRLAGALSLACECKKRLQSRIFELSLLNTRTTQGTGWAKPTVCLKAVPYAPWRTDRRQTYKLQTDGFAIPERHVVTFW